jgi:hypothetical protein
MIMAETKNKENRRGELILPSQDQKDKERKRGTFDGNKSCRKKETKRQSNFEVKPREVFLHWL